MPNSNRSHPFVVWLLIWLQVLLGLGALGGGAALLLAPDGHLLQMPLSILKNTPFSDYLIPGVLLFTFVGIYPIAVAYTLWRRPTWRLPELLNPFKGIHWSWAGSLAAGMVVIIWITVQVLLIGSAAIIHFFYVGWGVGLVFLTLLPTVRRHCNRNSR